MAKNRYKSSSREHLALNLKYLRALTGWSQEQLALRCDLKRTYIGALERGEINPGLDNIDCIARSVGVAAHVLILHAEAAHPIFLQARKLR